MPLFKNVKRNVGVSCKERYTTRYTSQWTRWEIKRLGHVVLYDLNSGMHQNCPILVRTRIAGKNNSGTLQVAGLFQQFWYVLELLEQFWYVRNPLAVSNAPISNHVSIILFAQ